MKKYLSIIAAALLMGSFSSCSDFLDRYPLEELSDESFWKTEKDAEMAVSNLYNVLPTWDVDEAINSDDAVHGIKWQPVTSLRVFMTRLTTDGAENMVISVRQTLFWKNPGNGFERRCL